MDIEKLAVMEAEMASRIGQFVSQVFESNEFDTIQIVATKHIPEVNETISASYGLGNEFARIKSMEASMSEMNSMMNEFPFIVREFPDEEET